MRALQPAGDLFDAPALPRGLEYHPDFLTTDDEAALLRAFVDLPFHEAKFQQYTARRRVDRYGLVFDEALRVWVEGRPLPIYGDGGNVRDWLHVEDHCAGLSLALREGVAGEKYNIGGSGERTNLQIVDGICAALEEIVPSSSNRELRGRGYASLKTFVTDRPGHDRRYAIDASRIRRELGWRPTHEVESGLRSTVKWYVDHRDWCRAVQAGRYDRERLGTR